MGPEIGLIASIGSSIFGFIGSMQQAEAQAAQAEYQAQVNRNNQILAEQNARHAASAGEAAAQQEDFRTRAALGTIAAAQGASGLDVESPTSQNVRSGMAQLGRLDAQQLIANAALQSRSFMTQGQSFGAQAELNRMSARSARSAGGIGGFSSLLGGAASFSDKWMQYKTVGVV